MPKPLNDLQESLELLWSERHQQFKHMIVVSKVMLRQARLQADSKAIGLASRNLGYADFVNGQLEEAWDRLNDAIEIGRRHEMPNLIAEASNCLAGVYRSMGNTHTALSYLENALRTYESLGSFDQQMPLKMNMGVLLQDLGRHEEAISYFEGALQLLANSPQSTRKLELDSNLAMSLLELGNPEAARDLLLDVLNQANQQQLEQLEVRNLVNLGEVYAKLEAYPQALEVLGHALTLIESGIASEGKAYCLLNIATVQKNVSDWEAALDSLKQAQEVAEEQKIVPILVKIAFAQYEIYKQQDQPQLALSAFETYHRIYEQQRQHNAEQELRLFTLERDFEKTVAEAEISRLKTVELAELLHEVQLANQAKAKLLEELGVKTRELEIMAKQDGLTGVYNRHFLEQTLDLELQKAKQGKYALSIALLDIDNFKQVNDQFSHQIGDQVLVIVGQLMRNCIRSRDIAARYGGEEFVLALPRASIEQSSEICERLRKSIEHHPWQQLHPDLRITISIGISANTSVDNHEKLLHLADTQMYRAKRSGKNKVCIEQVGSDPTGSMLED
jgi:diguanylate cyclase (GGDEF)-like protein